MGYSSVSLVERILAQALTSGTPNDLGEPVDLLKIGNVLDTNLIPLSNVEQYIQWADSQIDSTISQLYTTPLCEHADFESKLLSDINDYNDFLITSNSCPFYPGDKLLLTDGEVEERIVVESIADTDDRNVFTTVTPILISFSALNTRVLRLEYPDPIPLTSARLAAANIYDKYFMAQSSPNESDYGKILRNLARADINNILNGRTILHGQHRIGRRFYNSTLSDRYGLPPLEAQGNVDIDQLG